MARLREFQLKWANPVPAIFLHMYMDQDQNTIPDLVESLQYKTVGEYKTKSEFKPHWEEYHEGDPDFRYFAAKIIDQTESPGVTEVLVTFNIERDTEVWDIEVSTNPREYHSEYDTLDEFPVIERNLVYQ